MEIEIGDFVTIINGDNKGWTGILDNVFVQNGIETFAVIDENDVDVFYYATKIKLYKKG